MTEQQAVEAMQQIKDGSFYGTELFDAENQHHDADFVLCAFLLALGYPRLVEAYNAVPK